MSAVLERAGAVKVSLPHVGFQSGLPMVRMGAPARVDRVPDRYLDAMRARGELSAADERAPALAAPPAPLAVAKTSPDVRFALAFNEAVVLKALIAASGCCVTISSIERATGCILGNAKDSLVGKLRKAWPRRVAVVHLTGAGWAICGHGDVLEKLWRLALLRLGEIETARDYLVDAWAERPDAGGASDDDQAGDVVEPLL